MGEAYGGCIRAKRAQVPVDDEHGITLLATATGDGDQPLERDLRPQQWLSAAMVAASVAVTDGVGLVLGKQLLVNRFRLVHSVRELL